MNYKEIHKNLITKSGGEVSPCGNYVLKSGIMITQKTKLTPEANDMFRELNLNNTLFPHAEFNSRITYLAFKEEENKTEDYLNMLVNEHGHLSIFNDLYATVLVSGVSVEAELEFVAHNEATIARLTSSRTAAQNEPLYVVSSQEEINYLNKIKEIEKPNLGKEKDSLEIVNRLNPAAKAVSFTITMSIKDWHKTFIGRFSEVGVEKEVRDICSLILKKLRKDYSFILKTEEEYYKYNNSKKLKD